MVHQKKVIYRTCTLDDPLRANALGEPEVPVSKVALAPNVEDVSRWCLVRLKKYFARIFCSREYLSLPAWARSEKAEIG
jgi:hypothetical protein